jgi:hypothetical protein
MAAFFVTALTPCHGPAIWTMLTPEISSFSGASTKAARARRDGSVPRRARARDVSENFKFPERRFGASVDN